LYRNRYFCNKSLYNFVNRYVLICFPGGRSNYSVGRLRIGNFFHKLGRVVLTLLSSCGTYTQSPNRLFTWSDVYQVFLMLYVQVAACDDAVVML
jgi:hypothetical protein